MQTLLLSIFTLLFLASPLSAAQNDAIVDLFKPKAQQQFYFLDPAGQNWVFLEDAIRFDLPMRGMFRGKAISIPSPNYLGFVLSVAPSADTLWANVIVDSGVDPIVVLYKWDLQAIENQWIKVAKIDESNGVPSLTVPLSADDLFLAISTKSIVNFIDDDMSASLVATFKFRDDKLEFVRCVDLGFSTIKSIVVALPEAAVIFEKSEQAVHKPTIFESARTNMASESLAPHLWPPGIYGKYLALYGASVGCVWVIELEKGTLHHTFYLDKVAADDLDALGVLAGLGAGRAIDPLILGAAFAPDGKLIVAKRHPELVKVALKLAKDPERANDRRKLWEDLAFFLEAYHEVVWLSIDLETKSVEDITAYLGPDAQPARKRRQGSLSWLQFVVLPSGKIVTNFSSSNQREWDEVLRGLGSPQVKENNQRESGQKKKGVEGGSARGGGAVSGRGAGSGDGSDAMGKATDAERPAPVAVPAAPR